MKDETILLSIIGAIILYFAYQFYKIKCRPPTTDQLIINSWLQLILALIKEINDPTNEVVKIFYKIITNRTKIKALYDVSKIVFNLNRQDAVDRINLLYQTIFELILEFEYATSFNNEVSKVIIKHFDNTEQFIIASTLLDLLKMWIDLPMFKKVNREIQERIIRLIEELDKSKRILENELGI